MKRLLIFVLFFLVLFISHTQEFVKEDNVRVNETEVTEEFYSEKPFPET